MNRRNDFRHDRGHSKRPPPRRPLPLLQDESRQPSTIDTSITGQESQYFRSLMETNSPIVAVLRRGEQVTGRLAWYDQGCLKIRPDDGSPSLVIPKTSIKYLYEAISPTIDQSSESEDQETTPGRDHGTSVELEGGTQ